ncbi:MULTISPECIES: hypothetical protein [unclassified Rhodococcus (in: high G+C Gram-positive bacteria)]|uniref:hypothetical protein n=1 Tax=unclassified Rhodococcus (in: high G+C Gram-positive bacteria) TaxID=192944 RepID=UPI00077A4D9D|nr:MULTISPECIES: hypothetical protein [unclassified Rhodococcus (in: high G+C Gram-positive bacteria)]KXX57675.1 hypothetical protein AZG88_10565 [Rhodococcus sp. LB1]PBC55186.1 hypothetical protein CJ177_19585 [Rhodococcus sp. ACPA1]
MPDAVEPRRAGSGAENYLLGTAGGEVVVHAGLVVTIGAIVGVYVGHWVLFVIALLGAAVWITGDIVVHVSRQRSPDISPATPVRHPVGRAA